MLYNVEKCTLNIYRSRVIYFVTLVATLDLKIKSRGKNDQTKRGSLGTRVHPVRDFFIKSTLLGKISLLGKCG